MRKYLLLTVSAAIFMMPIAAMAAAADTTPAAASPAPAATAAPTIIDAPPKTDGAKTDASKADGTKTDGTKADGTKTDGTKTDAPKDNSPLSSPYVLPVIMAVFLLMYFWMGRSRRKQEAQRKQLLSALKKGDKITTIGGIVGTIIEVRDNEVTVKTDETNNVRMKFARWAIRDIGEPSKTDTADDKK